MEMIRLFPAAEPDELVYLKSLIASMSEQQASDFAMSYNAKRRNATTTLLFTIFLGCGGRFYLGQMGMGFLYLFTGCFCGIGWIVDLVRYRTMTNERNREIANEVALTMGTISLGQGPAQPIQQPQTQSVNNANAVPVQKQVYNMSIVGLSGACAGQQFPITSEGLVIGRDPASCNVVLNSAMLSRRHARISLGSSPDSIVLEDLGSTNGTFVFSGSGWTRITAPTALTILKKFRLGDQNIEFEVRS